MPEPNVPDPEFASDFPKARWGDETVQFLASTPPASPAPFAALVFPFYGDRIVLADIVGRGWCIPSGRIEPGESAEHTARREANEEAGIQLGDLTFLGHYRLTHDDGRVRISVAYVGRVDSWSDFVPTEESAGRQLVGWEELAEAYCVWDPLLSAVFEAAWTESVRHLRTGYDIPPDFRVP